MVNLCVFGWILLFVSLLLSILLTIVKKLQVTNLLQVSQNCS